MNMAGVAARLLAAVIGVWLAVASASAQNSAWLQIAAQPDLPSATEQATAYSGQFRDVSGFRSSTGWYLIVLGPMSADGAAARLADLRGSRQIPTDSFISDGSVFETQFWPPTAPTADTMPAAPAPAQIAPLKADQSPTPALPKVMSDPIVSRPQPQPELWNQPVGLTAMRDLDATQTRFEIQKALKWLGFYYGPIDGVLGTGSRGAIAQWQQIAGYLADGQLDQGQTETLFESYHADLARKGLQIVQDSESGIEIALPTHLIRFDRYDPPFAHFVARTTAQSPLQVLLISQTGDATRLRALYKTMQTLEIVPKQGQRNLNDDGFLLTGQQPGLRSYTEVQLRDGTIKGFTLVWDPREHPEAPHILAAMRASFAPFGTQAMPDGLQPMSDDQARDMLSGLALQRPRSMQSGVYLTQTGVVLTTNADLGSCARLTLGLDTNTQVVFSDDRLGLAVLAPQSLLAPRAIAQWQRNPPRIGDEIATAGFSWGDALHSASLTFGTLQDLRGLNGQDALLRLSLGSLPGDAGGPVLDAQGRVLGILMPRTSEPMRLLPDDVQFALAAPEILDALAKAGLWQNPPVDRPTQTALAPEVLAQLGADMTVLVACWD